MAERSILIPRIVATFASLIVLSAGCTPTEELPDTCVRIDTTGSEVELEYVIRLLDGTEVAGSKGRGPLIVTMGAESVFPALEEALVGLSPGDKGSLSLTAEQAYGVRDERAMREVHPDMLPEDSRVVGSVVLAEDDMGQKREVTVREIGADKVTLDLNHPLAGKALTIEYKIVAVHRSDSEK